MRAQLEAVRLELARLTGEVSTLVATVQTTANAHQSLDARIRGCELACATCKSALDTQRRPPQWPNILAAVIAAVAMLWTVAQQID